MTHDQSWTWQSETSVNSRVDEEQHMPCYFGQAMKRIINWAVAARKKYPNIRILATKLDIISFPMMSPECIDGNSNLHPASRTSPGVNDAQTHLRRSPLPLRIRSHLGDDMRLD